MILKSDAKFKRKPTCGFKYDMRNLLIFHPTTHKSKNFFSMGSFCPKYTRFEVEKYRGVIFHDIEQLVMQNLNKPGPCGFKNGMWNWVNFH